MNKKYPTLIITGASGIVGRHFIETAKEEFFIYAIARRSQEEADIPLHPNIKWLQVDIGNFTALRSVIMNALVKSGSTPQAAQEPQVSQTPHLQPDRPPQPDQPLLHNPITRNPQHSEPGEVLEPAEIVEIANSTGPGILAEPAESAETIDTTEPAGDIDFVLHLASYYDFDYQDHPEYQRTNIQGTRNILEISKQLKIQRFVFSSSVAAARFPPRGGKITEETPVDADHPYAVSKKAGEEMVREYSQFFPCAIVRPAAVFTDWGEYGILYMQLTRWFSRQLGARVLEGKGEAAVPYIHSDDLNHFLLAIFKKSRELPACGTYIASPDGCTSHRELFETAAKFYFRHKIKPFFFPRVLIALVVYTRDLLGRLIGKRPFERPWMLKYIDRKLNVDSSYTRKILSWEPSPRLHILRRLLYLVEKIKTQPEEWQYRNSRAMKRVPQRPNLLVYDVMVKRKQEMIEEIKSHLLNPNRNTDFSDYQKINRENFNWDVGVFYQLLTASVRNKDRMLLINYAHDLLIPLRFSEGFSSREVCTAILDTGTIVVSRLLKESELKGMAELIHDYIVLTIQLTVDEVESGFEKLNRKNSIVIPPRRSDIEEKLRELATFCYQEGNNSK